jgi:MFS family permease
MHAVDAYVAPWQHSAPKACLPACLDTCPYCCAAGVGAGGLGVSGSLGPLLACRVLYGLGIGFAMHAAPAYIAETSPPSVRGLLISLKVGAV